MNASLKIIRTTILWELLGLGYWKSLFTGMFSTGLSQVCFPLANYSACKCLFMPCLLLHYFLHYVRDPSCSVLIFLSHLLGENLRENGNTRL